MPVEFLARGTGSVAAAADYLLGERDAGRAVAGRRRGAQGDPHLLRRVEHGTVGNRADVAALREADLEVPRRGKD